MEIKSFLSKSTEKSEYYPTPLDLANKMAALAENKYGIIAEPILEPSAGTGNIVAVIVEKMITSKKHYNQDVESLDIDCIEYDSDFQAILKNKNYHVVHDDFLTFNTFKRYGTVIMNPPFSNGDIHLLKALDMQKRGGKIVALLNAETLKNPYTNTRKQLLKTLTEYEANIEYIDNAFVDAERKTNVQVALICVDIPHIAEPSEIYSRMEAANPIDDNMASPTDLTPFAFLERIVRQYELEASSGIELIRQYYNMTPYISDTVGDNNKYSSPLLSLLVHGEKYESNNESETTNKFMSLLRLKYWRALVSNETFTTKLTTNLKEQLIDMVNNLSKYEFSMFNINTLVIEMNAKIITGIEETIMSMFDLLTVKNSYNDTIENGNVHYFNGWTSNKAYKIAEKVVVPVYGMFYSWNTSRLDACRVKEYVSDLEKIFNYLGGNKYEGRLVSEAIDTAVKLNEYKNIHFKFFDVTFYKKGTIHIKFTCPELLDVLNIYASRKKSWLPPTYGKKRYKDMTQEEKTVIDDFQGKEAYEKVMNNTSYYIVEASSLLSLNA